MRLLYVLATFLAFPLLMPALVLNPKTRNGFWQRLGMYRDGQVPSGGGPRLWLHGASAGDLLALAPVARELRRRHPGAVIIASTITNTGALMASGRLRGDFDAVVYAPWDLEGATRRAMAALAPDVLVLEYTEIWPNLIAAARASGASVVLTNGRFSPTRLRWYRLLFWLVGQPLRSLDALLMRDEAEAERATLLGAEPRHVAVTGNTKFDALLPSDGAGAERLDELTRALNLDPGAPVWVAGSTHEGEEEPLVEVFRALRADFPTLQLVLAPRYVERCPRVLAMVQAAGFTAALRSEGNLHRAPVVVLDSIGELSAVYALATLTFVGGSFTSRGGQNILEPAARGKPVLFGPHMENFRDAVTVLVGRGGIQVPDLAHLEKVMRELLERPATITSLGELARTAVRSVTGAAVRNAEAIGAVLARRGER